MVTLSGALPVAGAWAPYNGGPIQMIHVPDAPRANAAEVACGGAQDDCALEVGVDFSGSDIETTTASSPEDCCSKCKANSKCKFFTIEHQAGGTCWLKTSDSGRRPYNDHVSGQPGAGPPPPPPPPPPPHAWGPAPSAINSFFVNGVRQVRARYPNGNPQTTSGTCFSKQQHPEEGCTAYLQAEGQAGDLPPGTS